MAKNTSKNNARVNWEQIKRDNPEKYDQFHDEDDELSTLALLRGIHEIQEAGGSGADEQAFLDCVGFKPIESHAPAPDASDDDEDSHRVAIAAARQAFEDSTSGTKQQLQARIRLLEQQLLDAVSVRANAGDAFQAHVDRRVAEAVAAEYARSRDEIAALRRELLGENRLLEAVLQKYRVTLPDARAALAEYDATHPGGAGGAAVPPPAAAVRDVSSTTGVATRRRRPRPAGRRKRKGGAWCAP